MKLASLLFLSFATVSSLYAQEEPSDSDKALIEAVRAAGGQAMQLARNDARLTIAFHLSDKEISDDTIKLLAGLGKTLERRVLHFDLRNMSFREFSIANLPPCEHCQRHH